MPVMTNSLLLSTGLARRSIAIERREWLVGLSVATKKNEK